MTFRGVVSRQEWGARAPTANNGEQFINEGLIIHWEGPSLWGGEIGDHARCYELVRGIQNYHMRVGYSDIAYNDVMCPHGYIFSARWGIPMANAASGDDYINRHAWAACALMGEGDPVTQDLLDAYVAARNFWLSQGSGLGVRPHREIVSTACPGQELTDFAHSLNGTGAGAAPPSEVPGGGTVTPPPPSGAPPWPGRYFMPNSYMEGQDVQQWQAQMAARGWNIDADGIYGPQSTTVALQFQQEKGLVADGIVGPMTWDAAWTAPIT